jgi:hypothetical protein
MRLLRWAIVLALFGALGWFSFSVKLGHRTFAGHLERWMARHAGARRNGAPAKARPTLGAKAGREEPATRKRVELLESAARAASVEEDPEPAAPRKTRIDERLSSDRKKALDDLVSSRVTRR